MQLAGPFCIVIQQPFHRVCWYEFDTKGDAHLFADSLARILGLELAIDIVPRCVLESMIKQDYDA